jgi:hypothetical protein
MKKIISITCSKNESDLIETFVRVNSRIIDVFIFIDESSDSTREILDNLKAEGYRIYIYAPTPGQKYDQGLFMTAAMQEYMKVDKNCDFFVPLDCDEFLTHIKKSDFVDCMNEVPSGHLALQLWQTYIPISERFSSERSDGLTTCFREKVGKNSRFGKIIIPRLAAESVVIDVGSHRGLFADGRQFPTYLVQSRLGHFPVRDSQQIIRKAFSAINGLIRKVNRSEGEGYHVYILINKIIKSGCKIDLSLLQRMAHEYADPPELMASYSQAPPKWINKYELRYRGMSEMDNLKCMLDVIIDGWRRPLDENQYSELRANLDFS